jgi:multiple sugar transport system substrate-binding protein
VGTGRIEPLTKLLRWCVCIILMVAVATAVGGCGGSSGDAQANQPAIVTVTTNRDPTGFVPRMFEKCSEESDGKYRIEAVITPPTVDAQREQLIRRLAGKDPSLDVLEMDVIWTAEFATAGWLLDLTERVRPMEQLYVPAGVKTVMYDDKFWALPVRLSVAMLYYRTDLVDTPPKTWEELVATAKAVQKEHPDLAGLLWQAAQYEGLTVDALEFILAAEGGVLNEDGTESIIDENDGAEHAFGFMRSLFEDGVTPRQVTTFREEESRQMFQQGKAVFLRNWPYVYALAAGPDSKIRGKYDVVPLPAFEGRSRAGVLGGANYAISRYSKHPELAWDAMMCLTSHQAQIDRLIEKGDLTALESGYTDPRARKAIPFLDVARQALDDAYPRPITPYYNDVTQAIYRAANDVASGRIEPDEAVEQIDRTVQLAVDGKGEI